MCSQNPDKSQFQNLAHHDDASIAVRELCRTHVELRWKRYKEVDGIYRLSATLPGSPMPEVLACLEAEIGRLLENLPEDYRRQLAPSVASTHAATLKRLIPQGENNTLYTAEGTQVLFAIASGIEALRYENDLGMRPSNQDFSSIFFALMDKCEPPEAEDWRQEARRIFERQNHNLCTTMLWFIRERKASNKPISTALSVFLADVLQDYVGKNPEGAKMACRGAAIGSCTHDVAAMILAGVSLPIDYRNSLEGRPKILALLDACASHHGRIAFMQKFGPLDRYFANGEVPDYQ
jgi:hypothetical protein